ncbi:MAG: DUF2452 domain-containing protein [Chitinophagales bacterium]
MLEALIVSMEEKKKKPDSVVFDEKSQQYNANILPYATNVGAPSIQIEDISNWKKININKINHQFKAKYQQIQEEYNQMMEQFEYNNLIYQANFNFEPVIGEHYHLYRRDSGESFLSIIAPHECNFDHIGSFQLNLDKMWVKTS